MTWPFADLRPLSYGAILADPPWSYDLWSKNGEKKSPQARYACMPLDAIKALPVADLAQKDCMLMMWATAPMLPQALEVMHAWRFRFVSLGAWAKQSSTGLKWSFGTGYVLRSSAEFWLIGTIGKPRWRARDVRNLIVAPVREHSRKPESQYQIVERLTDGPYAELFARSARSGWASWGNQVGKFTEVAG